MFFTNYEEFLANLHYTIPWDSLSSVWNLSEVHVGHHLLPSVSLIHLSQCHLLGNFLRSLIHLSNSLHQGLICWLATSMGGFYFYDYIYKKLYLILFQIYFIGFSFFHILIPSLNHAFCFFSPSKG